ncbi:MAG: 50S ribosome-binding GTPase [Nanoarchaeota archaeon]|nr:50S ribosome-binding GTPase [Nanoarchaeota archaeon]
MVVERDIIGIFGRMNSGKSSTMNLITDQETSIVDDKPGTTADTKVTLMEIHGIGPVKIFYTAGYDEKSGLGDKKRRKAEEDMKECDLALIVISSESKELQTEMELLEKARESDKQILILFNIFGNDQEKEIQIIENKYPLLNFYKKIFYQANDISFRPQLIQFILDNYDPKNRRIELFPFLEQDEFYVLIVPMDVETPEERFLRPQSMAVEYITRNWGYAVAYRPDLGKARNQNTEPEEKKRFMDFIDSLQKRPKVIITDSQAMDVFSRWCPDDIMLTTFSITMANYQSRGKLKLFADGINALSSLKAGDKLLIAEACNHSRIGEDIGTVQIPNTINKKYPGVIVEHIFGRSFPEVSKLQEYKLIIHCGGCMITPQKAGARLKDLEAAGVPITNYGLFLSYVQGKDALKKVLVPWCINMD